MNDPFWQTLQELLTSSPVVIDRPKGLPHPRYPDLIYPLDYGYLEDTASGDGGGIDVWIGSQGGKTLTGIFCTFDRLKRDAEVKLLAGCTPADVETILHFADFIQYLYIPNPLEKT
jgi:inorganic pyrophosphatase